MSRVVAHAYMSVRGNAIQRLADETTRRLRRSQLAQSSVFTELVAAALDEWLDVRVTELSR